METLASLLAYTILACLPSFLLGLGEVPKPEDIKRELYCIGCEYTVKALHKLILQDRSSEDKLDIRVAESLQKVCHEDHFNGGEIPAKDLLKACEFLIEENEQVLEPLLVSHFSRASHGTYLDISQQVCIDLSKACVNVPGEKRFPDHLDADLEFDSESQTFRVKKGRQIRMPEPMRAKEDL